MDSHSAARFAARPPAQIVENGDRSVALTDQPPDQMTANKACAARHQNSWAALAAIDSARMVHLLPFPRSAVLQNGMITVLCFGYRHGVSWSSEAFGQTRKAQNV